MASELTSAPIGHKVTDHGIADDVLYFCRRFIAADDAQLAILPLYILFTHSFLGMRCITVPYLYITSAEKECGKSTVLDILDELVRNSEITTSITPASLARKIEENDHPTLLIDQMDTKAKGDKERFASLMEILDGGYRKKTARYTCMVGVGTAMKSHKFDTFGPKILAGIGELEDALLSRCIVMRLKRASREDHIEDFVPGGMGLAGKVQECELSNLRKGIESWAKCHAESMANAEPDCPSELRGRRRLISEPLLAIADLLGGDWPNRARSSLLQIFSSRAGDDHSNRARLLSDIRHIFRGEDKEKLATLELIRLLCEIETSPWGDWHGKNITPHGLSKLLRDFEIRPSTLRDGGAPFKGYSAEMFEDAWKRYLPEVCNRCGEACNGTCNR